MRLTFLYFRSFAFCPAPVFTDSQAQLFQQKRFPLLYLQTYFWSGKSLHTSELIDIFIFVFLSLSWLLKYLQEVVFFKCLFFLPPPFQSVELLSASSSPGFWCWQWWSLSLPVETWRSWYVNHLMTRLYSKYDTLYNHGFPYLFW